MKNILLITLAHLCWFLIFAQNGQCNQYPFKKISVKIDLKDKHLKNPSAYIPPQCYVKTRDGKGIIHNPCYVCHTGKHPPNFILGDDDLQMAYDFPEPATVNPWSNLLKDKSEQVTRISDDAITAYIRTDNYKDENGRLILAKRLHNLVSDWDYNGNGMWDGYIPDCFFNFDNEGFDRDSDNGFTGWRAFAYYPLPGAFWPTNGSTDDVMIRLPIEFRKNEDGDFDVDVYKINLAIVESLITRRDVYIGDVDETKYGVDLNMDGKLGQAKFVKYLWPFSSKRAMSYVGLAKVMCEKGKVHIAAGLFPEGTEFLHSVRYLDFDENGTTRLAPRMKELRYGKKLFWLTYSELKELADAAQKEKYDFPDRLETFIGNMESGLSNGQGWIYQGFIEDANGNLRPQSYEETLHCMGCHSGVGATTDSIYSFPRKIQSGPNTFQNGWYHWSQKDLTGMMEPKILLDDGSVFYEYSFYLMYNLAGNDYRSNEEINTKFFAQDGSIKEDMLSRLHDDISILLNPSPQRALLLNKAYRAIVAEQSFVYGRDANVPSLKDTLLEEVEQGNATGITSSVRIKGLLPDFGNDLIVDSLGAPIEENTRSLKTISFMKGPDGHGYVVSSDGLIYKSNYAENIRHVFFPFPERLALPTRMILPATQIPVCYKCHRLSGPVPFKNQEMIKGDLLINGAPFKTDVSTNGAYPVTKGAGNDVQGVWSPDSKHIAWVVQTSVGSQVWLMNSDGTHQHPLDPLSEVQQGWPTFSPDGSLVAFQQYDESTETYSIKYTNILSGETHTLLASQFMLDRPAWSPDGEKIAFSWNKDDNWDIYVFSLKDEQIHRMTLAPNMETNPLWSHDGKMLAFKRAGMGKYPLTEEYFMSLDHGLDSPIIHKWKGPQSIQMKDWSPDNKKITFTAEAISDASGKERVSYVAVVADLAINDEGNVTAVNPRIISKGLTLGDRDPVFAPDGKKIAFWAWDRQGKAGIWIYHLDSGTLEQITNSGFEICPKWSPDGSKLLFEAGQNDDLDLWIMSINTP